jgi:hypothetical protein
VFFGCVVYDKIHDKLHVALLELGDEIVDIGEGAVRRINVFVVCDIVAHVCLRAAINRAAPYDIYAQVFEVVEPLGDAGNIAPAITVCVKEGSWVNLFGLVLEVELR